MLSARVPHRTYAVGDIHGRLDLLIALMKKIEADAATVSGPKTLVFLGDYVDRGLDSCGVIEFLLQSLPADFTTVFLRGNHDDLLRLFLQGEDSILGPWLSLGGIATAASYGLSAFKADLAKNPPALRLALMDRIPASHRAFLDATQFSFSHGDYFFAHAGVRAGVSLETQAPEDLLWIRQDFLLSTADFGKIVVHGHTPSSLPNIAKNRIGIDTGAYATGKLTALVLDDVTQRFLATA